jgi:hypothetical protein
LSRIVVLLVALPTLSGEERCLLPLGIRPDKLTPPGPWVRGGRWWGEEGGVEKGGGGEEGKGRRSNYSEVDSRSPGSPIINRELLNRKCNTPSQLNLGSDFETLMPKMTPPLLKHALLTKIATTSYSQQQ